MELTKSDGDLEIFVRNSQSIHSDVTDGEGAGGKRPLAAKMWALFRNGPPFNSASFAT